MENRTVYQEDNLTLGIKLDETKEAIARILNATPETEEDNSLPFLDPSVSRLNETEKIDQQEKFLIERLRIYIEYHKKVRTKKYWGYTRNLLEQAKRREDYMRKKYPDSKAWIAGWITLEQSQDYHARAKKQYTFWLERLDDIYRHILIADNHRSAWDRRDRRHFTKTKYLVIGLYLYGIENQELRTELHNELIKAAQAKSPL